MEIFVSILIRLGATFVLLVIAALVAHALRCIIPEGRIKRLLYRKFRPY